LIYAYQEVGKIFKDYNFLISFRQISINEIKTEDVEKLIFKLEITKWHLDIDSKKSDNDKFQDIVNVFEKENLFFILKSDMTTNEHIVLFNLKDYVINASVLILKVDVKLHPNEDSIKSFFFKKEINELKQEIVSLQKTIHWNNISE
jgi:histidinol phosphatase-like PHP family hydrolase